MFQFLCYKHNTITKITIYMHSIMDLTEMWEPSKVSYIYAIWLRMFTILILKSESTCDSNSRRAVVNVNAIRIISYTLPQFGEM
jgi:hypothetical protein